MSVQYIYMHGFGWSELNFLKSIFWITVCLNCEFWIKLKKSKNRFQGLKMSKSSQISVKKVKKKDF